MKDNQLYYFDNNATTKLSLNVSKAMAAAALYDYGNPSSIYSFGIRSKNLIQNARKQVAKIFQADPEQIIFTGSATESNNTIIYSALLQNAERKTILYSAVEHPSVYQTLMHYQTKGYRLLKIPVSEKGIDEEYIFGNLSQDVALVTIMNVNNETGQIFNINRIFNKIKEFDPCIICHSDVVQAIGKINISTNAVDYMTASAHKFHGPKGVGCIYKNKSMQLNPLMFGGMQECGLRPGTENVSGIIGMGVASSEIFEIRNEHEKLRRLQNKLEDALSECDSYIVCKDTDRVPGVSNIGFKGIEANNLVLKLNRYHIYVSTGSACSSNRIGISRILQEMRIPPIYSSTIRISMSKYTSEEEVDYLIEKLKLIIKN